MKLSNYNLASLSAVLSAFLFALCIPFSKILNIYIEPVVLGGLLYLGAGLGLFITNFIKKGKSDLALTKKEAPFACAMVILDIFAITALMYGVNATTGANASLIGNFELVATCTFAYFIFREFISKKLVLAIILITLACIILDFEAGQSLSFNSGSIFVMLSALLWGLENNCTRKLSSCDTRQVATIKGLCSGVGSLLIAAFLGASVPGAKWIVAALFLGFMSYGVSVSLYIYAQRFLGASKTGAYFALAPYFGVILSLLILREIPSAQFYIALLIMLLATCILVYDDFKAF